SHILWVDRRICLRDELERLMRPQRNDGRVVQRDWARDGVRRYEPVVFTGVARVEIDRSANRGTRIRRVQDVHAQTQFIRRLLLRERRFNSYVTGTRRQKRATRRAARTEIARQVEGGRW